MHNNYDSSDVDNNTNIYVYTFIVGHSMLSCTVSARTSVHDDHFLNKVL